jgi:hypothetical protein
MSSGGNLNPESDSFENRPVFFIGQHDSARTEVLTDEQYTQVLGSGVSRLESMVERTVLTTISSASSLRPSLTSISLTGLLSCSKTI